MYCIGASLVIDHNDTTFALYFGDDDSDSICGRGLLNITIGVITPKYYTINYTIT